MIENSTVLSISGIDYTFKSYLAVLLANNSVLFYSVEVGIMPVTQWQLVESPYPITKVQFGQQAMIDSSATERMKVLLPLMLHPVIIWNRDC